jgi:hypothetical protein
MSRTVQIVLILVVAALVSAADYAAGTVNAAGPCPGCGVWLIGAPFVVAALALLVTRPRATPPPPPAPVEIPASAALRLLATLQEEGRLIDFLEEDVAPYSDEQIGAAVRTLHEGCRKALGAHVTLEPVLAGVEGESVTVPAGFDPAAIRLIGNVSGAPPFRGTLRHAGWRATVVQLPARGGVDERVIAPAEVEIA